MPHVHNALHHATRLQAAYKSAIAEADPAFTGLERAGETVTPVLDLWRMPEWALLRGDVLFSRFAGAGAVAARFSSVELVNPAGSGVLAVLERIWITAAGAVNIVVDSGAALGVTSTLRGVARDTRFTSLGETSRCTVVTGDFAAGATNTQEQLAATGQETRSAYIIAPGRKLFVIGNFVNTAISVNIAWRERIVGDEELASLGR